MAELADLALGYLGARIMAGVALAVALGFAAVLGVLLDDTLAFFVGSVLVVLFVFAGLFAVALRR